MEGFKKLPKMQSFKTGGKVSQKFVNAMEKEFPKGATITPAQDEAEDKKMVKSAVRQHEGALHKGEPKTELKLKSGGRAKKETGTVKKYCGGGKIKKMADGSLTEKVMGTPAQNEASKKTLDQVAKQDTMVGALERGAQKAANFLKGQGAVTDAERAIADKAAGKKRGGKC
jgi:hypothetical protein